MHFPCAPACKALFHQSNSTVQKSICWQEKQNLFHSLCIFKARYLPWYQTFAEVSCARVRDEAHHRLQFTRGPSVWPIKAEHASSSHPTTAVCNLPGGPVLAQLPAPICDLGEEKEKEKRNACGEGTKLPTSSWMSLKSSNIWLPSERYRPGVYWASFCTQVRKMELKVLYKCRLRFLDFPFLWRNGGEN